MRRYTCPLATGPYLSIASPQLPLASVRSTFVSGTYPEPVASSSLKNRVS